MIEKRRSVEGARSFILAIFCLANAARLFAGFRRKIGK
jgi:hypothetical protein